MLKKFINIEDSYIKEGIYSITYGVVLFSHNKTGIKEITEIVFKNIFDQEIVFPNILVRDCAYGIMQTAKHLGVDISAYEDIIEPPYNYPVIKKISQ